MMQTTFLLSILLSFFSFHENTGNLTVYVEGVKNNLGTVEIGIYNRQGEFLKIGDEFRNVVIQSSSPITTYTFKNIPFDKYAATAFHDENNDRKCNTNLIGIPVEGYGFSNNVKPFLSAPSFEKTQFNFTKTTSIHFTLRY